MCGERLSTAVIFCRKKTRKNSGGINSLFIVKAVWKLGIIPRRGGNQKEKSKIMYIVLGGTGHVGSSVAANLLERGEDVTIITHNSKKTDEWKKRGAKTAVVDVLDTEELRKVFKIGKRLFLLNPPADPATDTVTEEQKTLTSILDALENSGIEKVVGESTYGAQPGEGEGDLNVLYEMEQGLKKMNLPYSIIRAAYYLSNWDASLEAAKNEGAIHTLYPVDFKLPMVAPADIGKIAAELLTEPIEKTGIHYVEGPEMYSSTDVAEAFSVALEKPVKAVETPKEKWISTLKKLGFSETAARSMAAMTEVTLEEKYEKSASPMRGETTLRQYIDGLSLTLD